jgi:hypothetical protein
MLVKLMCRSPDASCHAGTANEMLGTYENVTVRGSLKALPAVNVITGTPITGRKNAVINESETQDKDPIFSPGSAALVTEAITE